MMTVKSERVAKAANKRRRLQAAIIGGCVPPKEYKICAQCGDEYPYFGIIMQSKESRTCPEWLTGKNCWRLLRSKNSAAKGGRKPQGAKKQTKDVKWWREEHCAKAPACSRISKCLDDYLEGKSSFPLRAGGACKITE
jgi:hypothetical protein